MKPTEFLEEYYEKKKQEAQVPQTEIIMKTYYNINFEKVKTIKDIILILKAMDLKIVVNSEYEIPEEILEITKFLKKED